MTNPPLRVAVVGCGDVARKHHLPNWKELVGEGRVTLAAVCDAEPDRAALCRDEFEAVKAFSSYETLLEEGAYDIIDICTQNRLHCPMTIEALKTGAHVLVEKPMAMNTGEARQMVKAAEKASGKLMVAHHKRFEEGAEQLKAVVEAGELGEIYTAKSFWLRRRGIPGWGRFHIAEESLGGALIDIGVHMLDLCIWLMGSPKPVAASGKVYRMFGDREDLVNGEWGVPYDVSEFDVEDYATARLDFNGGAAVDLTCSWNLPAGQDAVIEAAFYGTKGGVALRNIDGSFYDFKAERFDRTDRETLAVPPDAWGGRAAVAWTRQLARSKRYDRAA
ncbi:MAG: Gfo/Idh/MocA family protein, partial [Candidatus Hydrogenedentota bacterium]